MTFETSHNVRPAEVHFSFLHIDLWILPLDRRNDRCVFPLSAGPGERILARAQHPQSARRVFG